MKEVPQHLLNQSVSHGTMRAIDLYESFISVIEQIDPERAKSIKEIWNDVIIDLKTGDPYDNEDALTVVDRLFDMLGEYAPQGYYFGAIEGDGSDYGFWSES